MCGIAGFVDFHVDRANSVPVDRTIARMTAALHHRGPDDGGVWVDPSAGVALGHRRLAIVDRSGAGAQPMVSANGRFVLVYNGELYNTDELRRELEARGQQFRGRSDTEVLLEGCAAFGVKACLEQANGMFAFALWDRDQRRLTLARDRLGEKPLYWAKFGPLLLFGSELKALLMHPGCSPEIDRQALADFMRWRFVPAPASIYRGVYKLPQGHLLEWSSASVEPRAEAFWSLPDGTADEGRNEHELVSELDGLLHDAVGRRMIADVPLGAFLSGGIDSSLTVALMQAQGRRPVQTFSIGFAYDGFDEAPAARAVAAHLGTAHTELYVDARQALDIVPQLPEIYDEPFADASQIPTHLLAKLTRDHVTVALSGDGGDELFAGYRHYAKAEEVWRRLKAIPSAGRRGVALGMAGLRESGLAGLIGRAPAFGTMSMERLEHWEAMLDARDPTMFYRHRRALWQRPEKLLQGPCRSFTDTGIQDGRPSDLLTRMQLWDLSNYLPDDVLTKVDRATMAVALEARVPLLDHRLVEFALRLPRHLKVREGRGKWILREVLRKFVPDHLVDRPKAGFSVPLADWLRGPLRDWAEDLLEPRRLEQEGYFRSAPLRQCWGEHLAGDRDWHAHLWAVLMFQEWLRHREVKDIDLPQLGAAAIA